MNFDWTISFGHLLTAGSLIGGVVFAYFKLRSDVNSLAASLEKLEASIAGFREDVNRLNMKLVEALVSIGRLEGHISHQALMEKKNGLKS